MEVLLLSCVTLLDSAHNELQEQNHLQEENKEQTSAIGFQPAEYCMYSLSVSALIRAALRPQLVFMDYHMATAHYQ